MARFPRLIFYNFNKTPVSITGIGQPGDHLYRFSYKYAQTDPDECTVTLVFPVTNVDLLSLSPGIGYMLRWGYVNDTFMANDDYRIVVIKEVEFKYSSAGFVVTLKMVPHADYTLDGTVKDPNGDSLAEVIDDALDQTREYSFKYQGTKGPYTIEVITKRDKDGNTTRTTEHRSSDGRFMKDKLEETSVKMSTTSESQGYWDQKWAVNYKVHMGKVGAVSSYYNPYLGSVVDGLPSPNDPFLSERDYFTLIAAFYRMLGVNRVAKTRDDKIIDEPVDWGAEPEFSLVVGRDIISYEFEQADKEAKVLQNSVAATDPTTKETNTNSVTTGRTFQFLVIDKTAGEENLGKVATYYQKGDSYYMKVADGGLEWEFKNKADWLAREKFSIESQKYIQENGWNQEMVNSIVRNNLTTAEFKNVQDKLDNYVARKRIEDTGATGEDIYAGHITFTHSAKTLQQIEDRNVQEIMDSVFYNTKLTLKIEGNPYIQDATNINFIAGNVKLDGKYHIDQAEHAITKSGYITTLVCYRVIPDYDTVITNVKRTVKEGIIEAIPELQNKELIMDVVDEINSGIRTEKDLGLVDGWTPYLHDSRDQLSDASRATYDNMAPYQARGAGAAGNFIRRVEAKQDTVPRVNKQRIVEDFEKQARENADGN